MCDVKSLSAISLDQKYFLCAAALSGIPSVMFGFNFLHFFFIKSGSVFPISNCAEHKFSYNGYKWPIMLRWLTWVAGLFGKSYVHKSTGGTKKHSDVLYVGPEDPKIFYNKYINKCNCLGTKTVKQQREPHFLLLESKLIIFVIMKP